MKKLLSILLFLLFAAVSLASKADAAMSRGIEFKDEISVDGKVLTLHGIGLLKWKYIISVYLIGLYKPHKVSLEQLSGTVPKQLEYYFFVDMAASDFQNTGFQLMAQNIGKEKAETLRNELKEFNALYQDVKAGQRYTLTFLPGKGLEMALDGKVLGVVQGDEFGSAYLSIWLGPDPVSKGLQEGMFSPLTKDQQPKSSDRH